MSLDALIHARISAQGPISVADYMAECLLHPVHGYYARQSPFGVEGDFTTAPEISQMFGELIGLCLAQAWQDQGAPSSCTLAELGPGRGTLMADVLRATRQVPGFHAALRICLVEASQKLRSEQEATLAHTEVTFLESAEDLPQAPLLFVANEFFDALPIRQFQRAETGWCERLVGAGPAGGLRFGLGPETGHPALTHRLSDTKAGDVVEYAPALPRTVSALSRRIAQHGGAGLVIDYGDWRSVGDTLQAVRNHRAVDVLDAPGASDLTAHVDFEALAAAAECAFTRVTPQGLFLERLGITQRARKLAAGLKGTDLEAHIAAHRRLTHPDEMGNLFKVLGFYPPGSQPPPGLEI